MTADSWSKGLRGPNGGRLLWCVSALRLRLIGRVVLSAVIATSVLITTSKLETSLRASAGTGAPDSAPVLVNPGNQNNTDNSSYEQVIVGDSPAAYWRLDETSAGIVADRVASNIGTTAGVVMLGLPGALADGSTAIGFNGSDTTRIAIPGSADLAAIDGSSAISMEAWINPQSLTLPSNFRMFFSFPGNPVSYLGVTSSTGSLKVIAALSIGGRQRHIAVGPSLTVGAWSHVVATYDGSKLTLYVNGDVAGQITGLTGAISVGSTGVLLGGHPSPGNNFAFDGSVDEAALYGYALSPAQIAAHYAHRSTSGAAVALQLSASDPDADPLTYSATGLPAPLILDPAAGLITGRLTAASAGVHEVTVTASDGQLSHSQTFTWTVTHINRAPIVANPGNQVGRATTGASLQPTASDADLDTLTYSAIGLPPSLTIDSATGLISGLLTTADIGAHLVTLTVSDGTASDSQTFTWSVTPANRAPVLTHPGDQTTSGRTAPFIDTVLVDSPAGYWRLGEASGTEAADRIGNSAGSIVGGVTLGLPGALADGNRAMRFDGIDGTMVAIPNNDTLSAINGSTAITMEAWINPQTSVLPSRFRMFYSFPGAPASYLGVTDAFGGLKVIAALWVDGKQRYVAAGPTLEVGSWYHAVATYDGAQLTLFVNGVHAGQVAGLKGPLTIGSGGMSLGGHSTPGNAFGFDGLIDEAAIYNYALSPMQIGGHYARADAAGADVRLQLVARDIDGDTLSFSAAGLPSGLTIDSATGLISGSLTTEQVGTHYVAVTVSDGVLTHTQTFTWWVTDQITYSEVARNDSPVSYWRLGDSSFTEVIADSAGTNIGVRLAGVTPEQPGAIADGNPSMFFDGIDGSKIAIPGSTTLDALTGSTAITLEAWINPFTSVLPSRFRMFYSFPGSPASYLGVTDAFGGGMKAIGALWINGRQRYLATGPALSVGSWNHTVLTYDGSRLTLYVNGKAVGQITDVSGPLSIGTAGVTLGGHSTPGQSFGFNGLVDDAAIYNYALSAAQIARHYALRRSAPLTGLILSSDPEAPVPAGQAVTFTATASGGIAPHEFKWYVYTTATGWTVARDWSTTATLEWTPAVPDRWAQVTVWARSAGDPSDLPEQFAAAPFPVFVVSHATTARLLPQNPGSEGRFDLTKSVNWTNIPGAEAYRLQVGTTLGGAEVLDTGEIQETSFDVSTVAGPLPRPSVAWDYDDTDFSVAGYAMKLDDERADFGYVPPSNCKTTAGRAPCYRVSLPPLEPGTHSLSVGAYNPIGEAWSSPVAISPTDDVFVRLWTKHGGVWRYVDSQFGVDEVAASFIYPLRHSVRVDLWKPIRWNAIPAAEAYSLIVGRTAGGSDLVNVPEMQETSFLAPTLPGNVMLYARLGTKFQGVWRYADTQFVARPIVAHLAYPIDGETRVPLDPQFYWEEVPGAEAYSLDVGSAAGGNEIVSSGEIQENLVELDELPPGTRLYARLGTKLRGQWYYVDSTFSTVATPGYGPLSAFITPSDGAELGTDSVEFTWTEVPGILGYHLHVGTAPGRDDLGMSPDYGPETTWTVENLPRGIIIYARLYTQYTVKDWDHYVDIFFTIPEVPQAGTGR